MGVSIWVCTVCDAARFDSDIHQVSLYNGVTRSRTNPFLSDEQVCNFCMDGLRERGAVQQVTLGDEEALSGVEARVVGEDEELAPCAACAACAACADADADAATTVAHEVALYTVELDDDVVEGNGGAILYSQGCVRRCATCVATKTRALTPAERASVTEYFEFWALKSIDYTARTTKTFDPALETAAADAPGPAPKRTCLRG